MPSRLTEPPVGVTAVGVTAVGVTAVGVTAVGVTAVGVTVSAKFIIGTMILIAVARLRVKQQNLIELRGSIHHAR